jgi:hypothetical protein
MCIIFIYGGHSKSLEGPSLTGDSDTVK